MKNPIILLIARILLIIIFLGASFGIITNFAGTQEFVSSLGIPAAAFFLVIALLLKIVGGLSVLLGYKTKLGAILLLIFIIPVTFIVHTKFGDQNQLTHFMKNLAIIGGLLLLIATGPGRYSIDKK